MSQAGGALPKLGKGQRQEFVVIQGEALDAVEQIQGAEMPTASYTDVVYRGIALLREAVGKQVELRDPASRVIEVVDVWGRG